jgi:diguanylate cyclase (GGDEF)-like protein
VDDSAVSLNYFADMLREEGYSHLILARSVEEAYRKLQIDTGSPPCPVIDLILMDIQMPGIDGLQACRELKSNPLLQDIPVIIISGAENQETLKSAFDAGAMDFLRKPPERIELLARVRSALNLKTETDRRKSRELELIELADKLEKANNELKRLSSLDGLTGIPNRYAFNEFLDREWKRAQRHGTVIAAIIADVDSFKNFNDTYGHIEGDECLKRVAGAMAEVIKRGEDIFARYGGEEFVAILPGNDGDGAAKVAEEMRCAVLNLAIPHSKSAAASVVTVSLGVAVFRPGTADSSDTLMEIADRALYRAKREGRNRVVS